MSVLSYILDWAFHWILLWMAFELGKRWNEKDVAASIAALTETQSLKRRSQEIIEKPGSVTPWSRLKLIIVTEKSSG